MDKEHRMLKAQILQDEGKKQWEMAEMLGVTDRTIRNYLKRTEKPATRRPRASKLDAFKAFIDTVLEDNPIYNRELLIERLRMMGYAGRISILRDYAATVRKKLERQAVIRFETEMGWQAQADWKEFGKQIVDGRETKLYAFVMVLGYSRKPFVYFTTSMRQPTLLACHVLAFAYYGGIPHEILYDNMRTAFAPDSEGIWQATKRLTAFAAHCGFAPRRCRIRRPETKGKVERAIGYLDHNFWPRMEGQELSLATLNADVLDWLAMIGDKPLADFGESRNVRFEREKSALKDLPLSAFDVRETIPLVVSREGTIRHESNRYSVPAQHIGELVPLFVHPLHRNVELVLPDGTRRSFSLAPALSRSRIEFPGDHAQHRRRWLQDRDRILRRRRPRPPQRIADIEVAVRSPVAYEQLCVAVAASQGVSS